MTENGPARTDVRVNVKLQAVQMILLAREESNEVVEGYLRKRLFDRISTNLGQPADGPSAAKSAQQTAGAAPAAQSSSGPAQQSEPARGANEAPPTSSQRAGAAGSNDSHRVTKETISKAQVRLKELGFDPGGTDGALGPRSAAAIRKFQVARNLKSTGQLTPETLGALGVSGF